VAEQNCVLQCSVNVSWKYENVYRAGKAGSGKRSSVTAKLFSRQSVCTKRLGTYVSLHCKKRIEAFFMS
jgi:hypothetical protein